MRLITKYYLNARVGAPATDAPIPYYLNPGREVEIDDLIIRKDIEGNCIWYHSSDDDCFYWSGGFHETDLILRGKTLSADDELRLYRSAVNELTDKYKFVTGYRGMAAGFKEKGGQLTQALSLVFYVDKKLSPAKSKVPTAINYRGVVLRTDVRESDDTSLQDPNEADLGNMLLMGGSISEDLNGEYKSFGTRTLIVTKDKKDYLLTCYHVACRSLFNAEDYWLGENKVSATIPSPVITPGRSTSKLRVAEGHFDSYLDYALLEIGAAELFNAIPSEFFQGFYTNAELVNGFRKDMQLIKYGAATQRGNIGRLITYHSGWVKVDSKRNLFMMGLIEATKMSNGGDSGSPVLDMSNNKLVGYIVAGNSTSSFIIPFGRVAADYSIIPKI